MKNIQCEKVIAFLDMVAKQRNKCNYRYGWMEGLRYCEQLQTVLTFCWLSGGIDHKEYDSLCKKYKVRYKDIRKLIYSADILDD